MRPRILVYCDFYLPGFKSGGGMWTVVNLVDRLSACYDFYIVTRNYDSKSDRRPYDTVVTGAWNRVGKAQVFYVSNASFTPASAAQRFQEVRPDIVFLNSAFSMPVRQFLRARRTGRIPERPVVLAPCGEMSEGALSVKPLKKTLFLKLAHNAGLYKGAIWKASFDSEAEEIRRVMGDVEILTAPDLAPRAIFPDYNVELKPEKVPGSARIAFFSRVVPKKNLRYLLECLLKVKGKLHLDIIGPLEDRRYWGECESIIGVLPPNIRVSVAGAYEHQIDALHRLAESHFFAMPTLNENFGYVFIEALAAGCPLVISDRTAWSDIEQKGVGRRIPLEDPERYIEVLEDCIAMDGPTFRGMSKRARAYACDWLARKEPEDQNAKIFEYAMSIGNEPSVART